MIGGLELANSAMQLFNKALRNATCPFVDPILSYIHILLTADRKSSSVPVKGDCHLLERVKVYETGREAY
jgi:hypothetical protein